MLGIEVQALSSEGLKYVAVLNPFSVQVHPVCKVCFYKFQIYFHIFLVDPKHKGVIYISRTIGCSGGVSIASFLKYFMPVFVVP